MTLDANPADEPKARTRSHSVLNACRSVGTTTRDADVESITSRRMTLAEPSESSDGVLICNVCAPGRTRPIANRPVLSVMA